MTCDEAEILIHALIDGELDAGHAREVEAHVAQCPRCTDSLAAYRQMSKAVAATGPAIPPPMTSAVRTLDVAVDMGSLLRVVFVGCSAPEITHGEPSYPLVATSWPGSSRAGLGSRALDGDGR